MWASAMYVGFGNLVQIKVIFFLPMVFFVAGCSYLLKFIVNIVVCCDGVLGEWKMRDFFFWVLGSVYGMVSGILVFFFFWSSFGCFKNFPPNGKLELIQFESQL